MSKAAYLANGKGVNSSTGFQTLEIGSFKFEPNIVSQFKTKKVEDFKFVKTASYGRVYSVKRFQDDYYCQSYKPTNTSPSQKVLISTDSLKQIANTGTTVEVCGAGYDPISKNYWTLVYLNGVSNTSNGNPINMQLNIGKTLNTGMGSKRMGINSKYLDNLYDNIEDGFNDVHCYFKNGYLFTLEYDTPTLSDVVKVYNISSGNGELVATKTKPNSKNFRSYLTSHKNTRYIWDGNNIIIDSYSFELIENKLEDVRVNIRDQEIYIIDDNFMFKNFNFQIPIDAIIGNIHTGEVIKTFNVKNSFVNSIIPEHTTNIQAQHFFVNNNNNLSYCNIFGALYILNLKTYEILFTKQKKMDKVEAFFYNNNTYPSGKNQYYSFDYLVLIARLNDSHTCITNSIPIIKGVNRDNMTITTDNIQYIYEWCSLIFDVDGYS